jgi:2-isopropylmalate synthase
VLGKHSGRHALRAKTESLGYELSDAELSTLFTRFKELADRKKLLNEQDIHALLVADKYSYSWSRTLDTSDHDR